MAILHRIEEIRAVEHQKLRQALARVDSKLRELEAEERNPSPPVRRRDMFGDPVPDQAPAKVRVIVVQPLIRVWRPFEDAVLSRLDRWEEALWPLVRRWSEGELVGHEIQRLARDLFVARQTVDLHLKAVREKTWFVEEIPQLMMQVFRALDLCDRAEQEEVIPALLSGSRETADRAERTVTADDVARNLRANIMSDEGELYDEEEEDPPSSPWGRLWARIAGH